ncbi:hypothetical protein LTR37_018041 [Vermiconidia calcicola]|uniref:Uncharacterized protein n=1 Tax=Vermiconidia calcicola TaxID=1690605 RepID=A0ACC3MJ57_9PEZI|nr:hypothetical protein LTR37_018041 [Vermiconidia calcicola]
MASIEPTSTAPAPTNACFDALPNELLAMICGLLVEDERVAPILPAPTAGIDTTGAEHEEDSQREDIIITSCSPLLRINKNARHSYLAALKKKAMRTDVERITVYVQDLNFCYFENNFLEPILTPNKDDKDLKEKLARAVYPIHLTFTDGFLQNPIHNGAQSFMDSIDKGGDRQYSFYYVVHPIPHKYVDSLRLTFNNLVFAKACKPGPELAKLMSDVGERFNSGEITIPGTDAIEGLGAESIKIPLEEPMEWNVEGYLVETREFVPLGGSGNVQA